MYAVTVRFTLIDGQASAFMPLVLANARASLSDEPGCRQFDVCTDPDKPGTVLLYELYNTRAAFDAHLASTHFRAFDAAAAPMIAAKDIATFREVTQ